MLQRNASANGHARTETFIITTRAELRRQVAEAVSAEIDVRTAEPGPGSDLVRVVAIAWLVVALLLALAGELPWV